MAALAIPQCLTAYRHLHASSPYYARPTPMPDRSSLGRIGFLFGGITAAVVMIAAWIVEDHINGRLHLEDTVVTGTLH